MRIIAAAMTDMMMMMMISSSLSPALNIFSVTSSLQELLPTSLLTRQAYSPNIYKANKFDWSFTLTLSPHLNSHL